MLLLFLFFVHFREKWWVLEIATTTTTTTTVRTSTSTTRSTDIRFTAFTTVAHNCAATDGLIRTRLRRKKKKKKKRFLPGRRIRILVLLRNKILLLLLMIQRMRIMENDDNARAKFPSSFRDNSTIVFRHHRHYWYFTTEVGLLWFRLVLPLRLLHLSLHQHLREQQQHISFGTSNETVVLLVQQSK